jgi:4'-phosphopantetheinyl transferase
MAPMHCVSAEEFVPTRPPVELADDEVHVWFRPGKPVAASDDRWSRRLLGSYLGVDPGLLRIGRTPFGKPFLDGHAVEFNLSHTRGGQLFALLRNQPVGIDIEGGGRRRPVVELARRFFARSEAEALERLPPEQAAAAFIALWSCKEAVLKAHGRGLGFGLSRLAFSLAADGRPVALSAIDDTAGSAAEWQIVALLPPGGFRGAVAWRGPPLRLRVFTDTGPAVDDQDHSG